MSESITYEGMEYHVLAYLDDIAGRMRDIRACEERIDEAERRLGLMGVTYTDMPGPTTAYGDAVPDGIVRLMEARERLDEERALHQVEIDRAERMCRKSNAMKALWLNRVLGMSWPAVASKLHVGDSTVYMLRIKGIAEIYCAMPEEWRRSTPNAI